MNANHDQLNAIRELFDEAERRSVLLWLESGWAMDARLKKITRRHDDIDIAFAGEQEARFRELLDALGFASHETTDYGFLCSRDGVLLDCEPCVFSDGEYNFDGFPIGSCPLRKEGVLENDRVRCLSWAAMYWEFLDYKRDVPASQWRDKDFESWRIIEENLRHDEKEDLQRRHAQTP